ncbi:MAG TPA: hypothetical protein DIT55_03485 [Spirochaetaceae bacterium]|nr:hypothetical protein [Spirochaetaceae bacterium]
MNDDVPDLLGGEIGEDRDDDSSRAQNSEVRDAPVGRILSQEGDFVTLFDPSDASMAASLAECFSMSP